MPLADLPQSNKMHAVPQNIMDVEFKLIGDLTIRQFIYLLIFGGLAYVGSVVMVGLFKWPLVLLLAILGIGLAFVPIQERGLDEWIVNFIRSVYAPTQRIWMREPSVPSVFMHDNLAVVKQELITLAPTSSRRRLEEYLEYQLNDDVVDPLDIPEKEYSKKVRDAFASEIAAKQQSASVSVGVLEPEVSVIEPKEETPPPLQLEAPTPPVVKEHRHHEKPAYRRSTTALTPMTPDMHSGRRFTNLLPTAGELILPIRGERTIRTTEELAVDDDIQEKAERLQQLLAQIKRETGVKDVKKYSPTQANITTSAVEINTKVAAPALDNEARYLAEKLEEEKQRLSGEISKLENQKSTTTSPAEIEEKDAMIKRLRVEKERTQSDFEALQKQILDLQNKLKEQEGFNIKPATASVVSPTFITAQQPIGRANVVSGVVKMKDGTTKEGMLLIMKNQKGEVTRAFKTNLLGQFKLSTPLSNGIYTVEVTPDNNGSTFDIISVQ